MPDYRYSMLHLYHKVPKVKPHWHAPLPLNGRTAFWMKAVAVGPRFVLMLMPRMGPSTYLSIKTWREEKNAGKKKRRLSRRSDD